MVTAALPRSLGRRAGASTGTSALLPAPGRAEPAIADAPTFVLADTHGRQTRSDDLKGAVLVLNFWAFWCDTWKEELPHLKALAGKQEEVGFRLVAVSVDGTRMEEFRRLTHDALPFSVLLDAGGAVSAAYHVEHVPTVVVIDATGRIRFRSVGYPGNDVVLHEVKRAEVPCAKSARQKEQASYGRDPPRDLPSDATGP